MTPMLLVALAIPHWPVGPQVEELHRRATEQRIDRVLQRQAARLEALDRDFEALYRAQLEMTRRRIALLESEIKSFELLVTDNLLGYTPETIARMRGEIGEWREEVRKTKLIERELTRSEEQRKLNPGLDTEWEALQRFQKLRSELWPPPAMAPPPRKVKR